MNPRVLEDGPDEPQVMTCQGCGGTGEAYAGRFASRPGPCRECLGSGEVVIDPDDWDDTRDHDFDPTLLWDDVEHDYSSYDYGRGYPE